MVDLLSLDRRMNVLEQNISLQLGGVNSSPNLQLNPGLSVSPTSQLPRPQCVARRDTTNQVIPSGVWTDLLFNTLEYDPCNLYVATNGRFVAPVAGWYLALGQVAIEANTTGIRGVAVYLGNVTLIAQQVIVPGAVTCLQVARVLFLKEFEYVTFQAYQDSGGNLDALATQFGAELTWGSLTQQA